MHPDGTFVIKGRVADAIRFKVFGDVIYPGPIEEVLSLHPDIKECSVILKLRLWLCLESTKNILATCGYCLIQAVKNGNCHQWCGCRMCMAWEKMPLKLYILHFLLLCDCRWFLVDVMIGLVMRLFTVSGKAVRFWSCPLSRCRGRTILHRPCMPKWAQTCGKSCPKWGSNPRPQV